MINQEIKLSYKFASLWELKLKLWAIRIYFKISNRHIARLLGSKNNSVIFAYERPGSSYFPRPERLFRLLEETGLTYDWLYCNKKESIDEGFLTFYDSICLFSPDDVRRIKQLIRKETPEVKLMRVRNGSCSLSAKMRKTINGDNGERNKGFRHR